MFLGARRNTGPFLQKGLQEQPRQTQHQYKGLIAEKLGRRSFAVFELELVFKPKRLIDKSS